MNPYPRFDAPPTIEAPTYFEGGRTPSHDQAERGAGSFRTGLFAGATVPALRGRARRPAWGDMRSPQVFAIRPDLMQNLGDATAGTESAPHLPGRVAPVSWDGEPGFTAPNEVG